MKIDQKLRAELDEAAKALTPDGLRGWAFGDDLGNETSEAILGFNAFSGELVAIDVLALVLADKLEEVEHLKATIDDMGAVVAGSLVEMKEIPKLLVLPSGRGFRLDLYVSHFIKPGEPWKCDVHFDTRRDYPVSYHRDDVEAILSALQEFGVSVPAVKP